MARNAIEYVPPPTVRDFIVDYRPNELFYDWIIGPVGSGKTTGILFKLAYMAQLQAPSPVDGIRRTRAVIIRNSFPQLRDTTIPSFNTWFKDGQAGVWYATPSKFLLKFADVECEILFRALDTADDVARVLSLEVTFALLDEFVQIRKEIVEALSARCGRYPAAIDGGATNFGMWGSSNPGDEDSWWYEHLIGGNLPPNTSLFVQPAGDGPYAENTQNLPNKYYENQAMGKSQEWINQFIKCQWGYSLNGKPVLPSFSSQLHVAKAPLIPNRMLPLVIGFDPGVNHSACIIGQEDLHGRLLIYDELILHDMGARRVIDERLKPLLRSSKYLGMQIVVAPDPAANNRGQTDEKSVVDIFRREFDVKIDSDNTLPPRIAAMEYYTTRLTDVGPALQLDPGVKTLARALGGGWCYTLSKTGTPAPTPDKQNPYSHPADAACYLARYFRTGAERIQRRKGRNLTLPRFDNPYAVR